MLLPLAVPETILPLLSALPLRQIWVPIEQV